MKLEIDVTAEQLGYLQGQAPRTGLSLNDWLLWKLLPPSLDLTAPSLLVWDDRSPLHKEISGEAKAAIFEMLEHIKRRPAMYLGNLDDVQGLDLFLSGFGAGLFTHGIRHTYPFLAKAMRAHSYETSARIDFLHEQMRERGLSDAEIVQERMMLEIESWQFYFAERDIEDEHKQIDANDSVPTETAITLP